MPFDLHKAFDNIVKLTKDPLGPMKVEQAYSKANALGQMLAGCNSQKQVEAIATRLLSDFEEAELEELSGTPAFTQALCGLLCASLIHFGMEQD